MGQNLACPECGQLIRNAMANAANKIKCGACGRMISILAAAVADAPAGGNATTSTSAETSLSIQPAPNESPAAALREPPAANYGVLTAAAWIVCIALTGIAAVELISSGGEPLIFSGNAWGVAKHSELAWWARAALTAMSAAVGMALVRFAGTAARLDRDACALAWRKSGGKLVVSNATGSSLPVMLPPMVVGGVLIIIGLLIVAGDRQFKLGDGSAGVGGLFCPLLGAAIFAAGLAFSELRRFVWRMRQFGLAIAPDNQAETLAAAPSRHAPILFASAAVAAVGAAIETPRYYYYGEHSDSFTLKALCLSAGLVAYSAFRLALIFDDASGAWTRNSRARAQLGARLLHAALWTIIASVAVYGPELMAAFTRETSIQLCVFSILLMMLYAVRLNRELDRWADTAAGLSAKRHSLFASHSRVGILLFATAAVCAALSFASIYESSSSMSSRFGYLASTEVLTFMFSAMLLWLGPAWIAVWFAMVLRTLAIVEVNLNDAAAKALAPASPVSPKAPAPASA